MPTSIARSLDINITKVAGASIGGGRRDNFYFCQLEHFPAEDRWFLSALKRVKDDHYLDGNEAIKGWLEKANIKKFMVDFPLTSAHCDVCNLNCPGANECADEKVIQVRQMIDELLNTDSLSHLNDPKKYERDRNLKDQYSSDSVLKLKNTKYLMSRSFKRKLKKGYLPYWNRPIDFWIWCEYHDQLLNFFKGAFDSFGNVSLMLLSRFRYLSRHFPTELDVLEASVHICLIELCRKGIVAEKDIKLLSNLEEGATARYRIIQSLEKKLKIFIYDNDLDCLCEKPKAFDSFLLALVGQQAELTKVVSLPSWTEGLGTRFRIPTFN